MNKTLNNENGVAKSVFYTPIFHTTTSTTPCMKDVGGKASLVSQMLFPSLHSSLGKFRASLSV